MEEVKKKKKRAKHVSNSFQIYFPSEKLQRTCKSSATRCKIIAETYTQSKTELIT